MWATELSLEALPSFVMSSIVSLFLSHEVEGGRPLETVGS